MPQNPITTQGIIVKLIILTGIMATIANNSNDIQATTATTVFPPNSPQLEPTTAGQQETTVITSNVLL